MAKKIKMKPNNVGKENKRKQEMLEMVERGQALGETLIGILMLTTSDWKSFGSAAIGMAKALAALRKVADEACVDIDDLYNSELSYYESYYEKAILKSELK